jgi:hypothetical protein
MLKAALGSTIVLTFVVVACGGTTHRPGSADAGGAGIAGGGAANQAGMSGVNAITGGAADAGAAQGGSAGSLIISDEPTSCTTADGAPGILVKILPYPGSQFECVALDQPGSIDMSCPDDAVYRCDPIDCYAAKKLVGCCRPDHLCGLLEQGFFSPSKPLGCLSNQAWIDHPEFVGHDVEPKSCGN